MTTFGENLKQVRHLHHLTQAELADQLNISRSAISSWEVGRSYPDLDMLVSLSRVLQISVDQLIKEAPVMVATISREQHNNRKRKLALRIIVPVFFALSVFTAYLVYQDVDAVNRFFSPNWSAGLTIKKRQANVWTTVVWDQGSLVEGSIFRKSALTNHVASTSQVRVRLVDRNGQALGKSFSLKPGQQRKLNVKSRQAFRVKVKLPQGRYILNCH
ncbi:helix-turn-helix domain-containing protein [Lapidilactobacillus luobeiensis]|uniref:helix-turn-helix domain-containing protein n=1 Tax=Lapidilactobacillus luobeiensis TaxID=2950371 RepID=UPI0021C2A7AF|nr:helix-turn-helix transcriptional regulator [Lapidilactobacillus luobeiensis]